MALSGVMNGAALPAPGQAHRCGHNHAHSHNHGKGNGNGKARRFGSLLLICQGPRGAH